MNTMIFNTFEYISFVFSISSSIYNIRIVINYYYVHSKISMKLTVMQQDLFMFISRLAKLNLTELNCYLLI